MDVNATLLFFALATGLKLFIASFSEAEFDNFCP